MELNSGELVIPWDQDIALSVCVMLEGWEDHAAPSIGPMGNPLREGALDMQARSWAEYGPKKGAWHILRVLKELKVEAVFYTSGIVAEPYPDLVKAIAELGHHVAAHAWAQNLVPAYQSQGELLRDIDRCVSTIRAASGTDPEGWMSPRCTATPELAGMLAKAGFRWTADTFDNDLPYLQRLGESSIVAMPFTTAINDMPLTVRYGQESMAYTRALERLLSEWPSAVVGKACFDLTVHSHVFGRPQGIIEFRESLGSALKYGDTARLTNHKRLADLFRRSADHE